MQLSFNNQFDEQYNEYEDILYKLSSKTLKMLKIKGNFIIELNFVDNKTIKAINKQYRKIDKETDVISFAFLELKDNEVKIQGNVPQILGEIDISIEKIISQAKELNHTFKYELIYLYIHGLLHLLGYDHVHNEGEAKVMFDLEEEILKGENI